MSDSRSHPRSAGSLAEQLALALVEVARQQQVASEELSRRSEERQQQLDRKLAQAADLEDLRERRNQLDSKVQTRRREVERVSSKVSAAEQKIQELERRLDEGLEHFRERCRERASARPVLDPDGVAAWIEWLVEWHLARGRGFEPARDWTDYLETRSTVGDALQEIAPLIEVIEQLEVNPDVDGVRRIELPAEIERQQAHVEQLEEEIQALAVEVGSSYGRILEDLPDPSGLEDVSILECYEGLLSYLEQALGRFAASARLESMALEVLE